MSTESTSDGTSPGPIVRPRPTRWGGTIFFKVEEIVFEAPRYRFAEHSEVFETMFHLPAGSDGIVEGRDEKHPIALEGYQAAHFHALLKILYPTPDDSIFGTFKLEKEEWIGVLNLSTRWNMKKVRKHAIGELCKASLSPVEKIALGREHKVAKWFQDGMSELISEHPTRPLAELKSQLGAEMVCTLLWIQTQTLSTPLGTGFVLSGPTLSMLSCYYCEAAMFTSDRNCHSCGRTIAVDDPKALYVATGVGTTGTITQIPATGPATSNLMINLQYLLCRRCSREALPLQNHTCPTCSLPTGHQTLRVISPKNAVESSRVSQKVLEEFGDEIAGYESWDQ